MTILCLAPNSVFVSSLLFVQLFLFPLLSFFTLYHFFFSIAALVQLDHPYLMRTSLNMYVQYTWGLLVHKLETILRAPSSAHMRFPYVPFLRHYMHRYDLSFGQDGLPGSCVYALCSR